ncbi:MAG: phosphotransferase family protein [Candidatus Puniceispirillaceae bacterium]
MSRTLYERCCHLLAELDLLPDGAQVTAKALSGGVASDIAKVTVGERIYCIKFALAKLRVKADWFAPVERNYAEYRWLKAASEIAPETALALYGHSASENGFAMAYLEGDNIYLLKDALLSAKGTHAQASAIGSLLGKIHAASSMPDFDRSPFHNRDDFYALRLEPYLIYTSDQHSDLAPHLRHMSALLYEADTVLVHGDVSPKNIIFDSHQPYLLDAECATMGDGVFDIAFCLNHYVLKAVAVPQRCDDYLGYCAAFWQAYEPFITWEEPQKMAQRLALLLPMLMLARIDGKSPVEYFNDAQRDKVRQLARRLISASHQDIHRLFEEIKQGLHP